MHWIYLSPHLDDVALSCGGLVWEQSRSGDKVEIWTVCGGDPPDTPLSPFAQSLHDRWRTGPDAVKDRRQEDRLSTQALGASYRHLDWPDCIYRFHPESGLPVIQGEYDLFHARPEDTAIHDLTETLRRTLPKRVRLVSPMALGDHIDHHLTRMAAERLGVPLLYYPDYPYILHLPRVLEKMELSNLRRGIVNHEPPPGSEVAEQWARGKWSRMERAISEEGLLAWQKSIAAHHSQISTFWAGLPDMEMAIRNFWAGGGGRLWRIKIT